MINYLYKKFGCMGQNSFERNKETLGDFNLAACCCFCFVRWFRFEPLIPQALEEELDVSRLLV